MSIGRIIALGLIIVVVIFGLIQLVPYGRNHTNPPVIAEPDWDSPATRELAKVACFDCHSNETVWPWYSSIAPLSWLIQRDTDEGRSKLNFSTWGQGEAEFEDAAEVVQEGEMPPLQYVIMHPDARLNDAQKQQLIKGLSLSVGAEFEGEEYEEDD